MKNNSMLKSVAISFISEAAIELAKWVASKVLDIFYIKSH